MTDLSIGTALDSLSLPSSGSATPKRNLAQASESQAVKPVATQTQQAIDQTQQANKSPLETALKEEDIQQHLSKINDFLDARNSDVQFKMDKDTGMRIVKVVERDTGQVIRQFPTEETIKIAQALDKLQGLLLRQRA